MDSNTSFNILTHPNIIPAIFTLLGSIITVFAQYSLGRLQLKLDPAKEMKSSHLKESRDTLKQTISLLTYISRAFDEDGAIDYGYVERLFKRFYIENLEYNLCTIDEEISKKVENIFTLLTRNREDVSHKDRNSIDSENEKLITETVPAIRKSAHEALKKMVN